METLTLIKRRSIVIVALLSGLPSLIGNRRGIGISWDSTDYIAVGLSMSAGRGALDVTGQPMVIRPPGLSFFVMLGDWVSLSPDVTLRLINAVSMMCIVWCTHRLLQRAAVGGFALWTGVALVALSPALLDMTTMAWSEPPFLALVLVALTVATRERSWPIEFVLCALFTAMFFVRYVGPFFAAPIALAAALVQARQSGFMLAFLRTISGLGVAMVAPWLWLMRNKDISGYLTGYREPGGGTLLDPLKTFTGTLGSWLIARPPLGGNGGIYLNWNDFSAYMKWAGILVWAALVALVVAFIVSRMRHTAAFTVVATCLLLFVVYGAFSIYRFVYSELGPLDSRMMSGLYVPLVIIGVVCADVSLRRARTNGGSQFTKRFGSVIGVCALAIVAWHGITTTTNAVRYGSDGRYWGTEFHRTVPIHRFAADLPENAALFSNEPQSLFAATFHWPIRNQYQYDRPTLVPCDRRYFVWFNQSFLPDGKPVGATIVYEDSWGQVLDLGTCDSDITRYWP